MCGRFTVVLSKIDGKSGISLPGASFDVFLDGEYITSVTTDDAGEARVTLEKEGYVSSWRPRRRPGTVWTGRGTVSM